MGTNTLSRRSFVKGAGLMLSSAALAACGGGSAQDHNDTQDGTEATAGGSSEVASNDAPAERRTITIAILAREEPDVTFVADLLADKYDVVGQVFGDNNAINEATVDGSVDVNYFQNPPYLDAWNESRGTDLVTYGDPVFNTCDILVSRKYGSVDDIEDGTTILVANDNTNRARELRLLEAGGLIVLNPDAELPTVLDIVENPRNIQIIEVDPRSRVGAFPDVDAMVAPSITVYQMDDPEVTVESALLAETPEVYQAFGGTLLVVRPDVVGEQWLADLDEAFHAPETAQFILDTFKGAKIPYEA